MRTPVVVIGGFLGAGKTTLVNHLLRRARDRLALIVNDFGAINIDEKLIASQDGNVVALTNGCVCCSLGSDFSATLEQVLAFDPPPDRIVVETSGVSDPWRVAQLVKLEPSTELEAVVVLADATTFAAQIADRWLTDTLSRQILRADLIALNKCDLADDATRASARSAIAAIRAEVPVLEIANGELPEMIVDPVVSSRAGRMFPDVPSHAFRSWHWQPSGPVDETRFREVLKQLSTTVLRGKGFLRLGTEADPATFQMVGQRCVFEPGRGPSPGDGIVLIGTRELLQSAELERLFEATLVDRKH